MVLKSMIINRELVKLLDDEMISVSLKHQVFCHNWIKYFNHSLSIFLKADSQLEITIDVRLISIEIYIYL